MRLVTGLLTLCVILGASNVASAWDSRPPRSDDRNGWQNTATGNGNDHAYLAAQGCAATAGHDSYADVTTYTNDIEFGAWFEDQIGLPDENQFVSPLDYMTMRIMQTNHYTIPSQGSLVMRSLYWWITRGPVMRNRGIFGAQCVTMLGPNAWPFVSSGAVVRSDILYRTALVAARTGHMHTAWWLVGRATHYVEDLTHPFHDVSAAFPSMSLYNGLMCFHLGWNPFTTANCHWVIEKNTAYTVINSSALGFLTLNPQTAGYDAARQSLYRGGATWQDVLNRAAAWHANCRSHNFQANYDLAQSNLFPWAIQDLASMYDAFYHSYHQ